MRQRDISICDTVFDPSSKGLNATYQPSGDKTLYKVWLFLEGSDLPYVKEAKYILHKTFQNRYRTVQRKLSNSNCQIVIWTWGIFTVRAEVTFKDGTTMPLEHYLEYDNELRMPGVKFIKV